jgi:hypothetical protein
MRMARGPDDHDDSWVSRLDGLLEALQGTIERVATHVTETLRSTDSPNPRTNREGDQERTTSTPRENDRQSPGNRSPAHHGTDSAKQANAQRFERR